jgi:hypothetical protein
VVCGCVCIVNILNGLGGMWAPPGLPGPNASSGHSAAITG